MQCLLFASCPLFVISFWDVHKEENIIFHSIPMNNLANIHIERTNKRTKTRIKSNLLTILLSGCRAIALLIFHRIYHLISSTLPARYQYQSIEFRFMFAWKLSDISRNHFASSILLQHEYYEEESAKTCIPSPRFSVVT